MHNPHSKNNNNILATTATLSILGFFIVAASVGTGIGVVDVYGQVRDNSISNPNHDPVRETKAPMAASEDGNNEYVDSQLYVIN